MQYTIAMSYKDRQEELSITCKCRSCEEFNGKARQPQIHYHIINNVKNLVENTSQDWDQTQKDVEYE